jgi:cytochrome c
MEEIMLRRTKHILFMFVSLLLIVSVAWAAETKEDVVKAVNEAVAILQKDGEAGLAKVGEIRFGDGNYVFVNAFDGVTLMHIKKHLIGQNLVAQGLKDDTGKNFFMEFTKVAKDPGEGWVEYRWTKPDDPSKKFYKKTTYIKATKMDGKDVYVGAGIYLE